MFTSLLLPQLEANSQEKLQNDSQSIVQSVLAEFQQDIKIGGLAIGYMKEGIIHKGAIGESASGKKLKLDMPI